MATSSSNFQWRIHCSSRHRRTAFKGASCSAGSLGPSTTPANTPACAPPCLHGGACRQEVNSQAYYCDCSETGYSGANCSGQKALPSSASAPAASASACSPACQHGGLCKQEISSGAYFCSCAGTGYKGATCSALLTAYSPSVNSSKTASACSPPCQHGSACRQAVNSGAFYCDCEGMAFAGQDCSLPLGSQAAGVARMQGSKGQGTGRQLTWWAVLLIVLVCTLGLAAIGLGAAIIAQKVWSRRGPGFSRFKEATGFHNGSPEDKFHDGSHEHRFGIEASRM
ncbi:hypothetical protein CVIRNUC_010491 [Coccomyxa viridis]|uniref:EGF-like domain-containing protein n=1 Tax=Coccomyxa viridis TaxID=1274662 RepID=A0AAV1IMP0_9CHLO|nr:hypothetical protein CVIRNUC_010491 [Coccomyxa viridis]